MGVPVPWHHRYLWFWYLRTLLYADKNFFYRDVNVREAIGFGVRHAKVMLPYFLPWKDRPVDLNSSERKKYACDVAFVGHFENDGRALFISRLVEEGINVKVWGTGDWNHKTLGNAFYKLNRVERVNGEEYAKAISGAKISLCFMSRLNRDTYTRRCFEIPAIGSVLLAERTDELMSLFKEDVEACFFDTADEMVAKVRWLLADSRKRQGIANAGQRRVWADGHDIYSRAEWFLEEIER